MAIDAGSVKVRAPLVHPAWTGPSTAADDEVTESLAQRIALYGMMAIAGVSMVVTGWYLLVP